MAAVQFVMFFLSLDYLLARLCSSLMIKFKESIIKVSLVSVGKVNPKRQASVIPKQHSILMSI